MSLEHFSWNDNSRKFKKDSHALFGASRYHWIGYSMDKMIELYSSQNAKKLGVELHETAAMLIKHKIFLPDVKKTLNMYVNDSILLAMRPEQQLYYSDFFFGTADAIGIMDGVLHIHDLKTGKIQANIKQLLIYAAFFLLEYNLIPRDFEDIELRIYQNDDILVNHPSNDELVPLMDKIVMADEVLSKLKINEGGENKS